MKVLCLKHGKRSLVDTVDEPNYLQYCTDLDGSSLVKTPQIEPINPTLDEVLQDIVEDDLKEVDETIPDSTPVKVKVIKRRRSKKSLK
jgi:hypothetical protein